MKFPPIFISRVLCVFLLLSPFSDAAARETVDVCVYEATPGGIATAVRAAREGLTVVLVNHTAHPGGACSSGLGVWDTLYEGYRAPIYNELRQGILDHYREKFGADSSEYQAALPGPTGHTNGRFEAKVFEEVATAMIRAEKNIRFIGDHYPVSAEVDGRNIKSVEFRKMKGTATIEI